MTDDYIVQQVCDLPADRQIVAPLHTMKAYEGVEVYLHSFWPWHYGRCGQLEAPAALLQGKQPRYQFSRRDGGPQIQSGYFGEQENPCPCQELHLKSLAVQLVV